MGFVKSGSTINLEAYLTVKGREKYLSSDVSSKTIKKFSLGDSDTNYLVSTNTQQSSVRKNYLENGIIPDLTGDQNDCIKSLTDDIKIKYPLHFNEVSNPSIIKKYELRFFNNTEFINGKNVLNIKINLHIYFNWLLLHGTYSKNKINNFNQNNLSLNDPILKLYDELSIIDIDTNQKINQNVFINPTQADLSKFRELNYFFTEYSVTNTNQIENRLLYTPNKHSSLFQFLFSSKNISGRNVRTFAGLGRGSFMLFGREYGYSLYDNINKYYNQPDSGIFYTPFELENNNIVSNNGLDDISNVTNNNSLVLIPAIKIKYKKADNGMIEKIYPVRYDSVDIDNSPTVVFDNKNNQYIKLYSRKDKSAIQEEIEACKNYIISRNDIFSLRNNTYSSKFTLKFDTELFNNNNIKPSYLKIELEYDSSNTSSTNYSEIINYI